MADYTIRVDGDRPRAVFDPTGPGGEPIDTPVEHRMLWWIRDNLVGCPDYLQPTYRVLRDYLNANCQHHWRDHPECCTPRKPDCCPPHRQCLWCNSVEDLPEVSHAPNRTIHPPAVTGEA